MIRTLAALRTEYAAALARSAALLEREAFRWLDLISATTRQAVLIASNASSLLRLLAIWFGLHNSRNDSAVMTLRGLVQAIGNDAHYREARLANQPVVNLRPVEVDISDYARFRLAASTARSPDASSVTMPS